MFPILAVIGSAFLHPLMVSFSKKAAHPLTINLWGVIIASIIFSFVFLDIEFWQKVSDNALLIVISSLLHTSYTLIVLPLIARNEFQVLYPLTRLAPLFILVGEVIWFGSVFAWGQIMGILMILSGALIFGFDRKINKIRSKIFLQLIIVTFLVAGYFLVDKKLLINFSPAEMWAMISFQIPLLLPILWLEKDAASKDFKNWKQTIVFALAMIGTWYLALYALKYMDGVVVSSLRNLSILFGVILGAHIFKEGHKYLRYLAASLICLGTLFVLL